MTLAPAEVARLRELAKEATQLEPDAPIWSTADDPRIRLHAEITPAVVTALWDALWQKIETAPIRPFDAARWYSPHSDRLLLSISGRCVIGVYGYTVRGRGRWVDDYSRVLAPPTDWQPLPAPPARNRHGLRDD